MATVHLYTCPPGEQSEYTRSFGSQELGQCTNGNGEWIAVEIPEGVTDPWQPTMQEVADLTAAAILVLGVAWGFAAVRRFTFGRR